MVSKLVSVLKLGKGSTKGVSRISWFLHAGLRANRSTSSVLEHAPDTNFNSCRRLYCNRSKMRNGVGVFTAVNAISREGSFV